jgi:hypothetical protein
VWYNIRMPKTYTTYELIQAIEESISIAQVLRRLNLKAAGGNYQTIKNEIRDKGLNTSHFKGQAWNKGKKLESVYRKPLSEVLQDNSPCNSWNLKKRLFREKVFQEKCYNCGLTEWLGKPISLELEHINGDHNDNREENLTILCPNCHAQTPTYRGKNIARMV